MSINVYTIVLFYFFSMTIVYSGGWIINQYFPLKATLKFKACILSPEFPNISTLRYESFDYIFIQGIPSHGNYVTM